MKPKFFIDSNEDDLIIKLTLKYGTDGIHLMANDWAILTILENGRIRTNPHIISNNDINVGNIILSKLKEDE